VLARDGNSDSLSRFAAAASHASNRQAILLILQAMDAIEFFLACENKLHLVTLKPVEVTVANRLGDNIDSHQWIRIGHRIV
jgi:ubiquinone biosynthesis protein COQ9